MLVRYFAVVLCFALCSFTAVKAEDPVANAQAVISGQIAALMNDDAEKAYSFASPGIRSLYPNKDRFLELLSQFPEIAIEMTRTLADRLNRTTAELVAAQRQIANAAGAHG